MLRSILNLILALFIAIFILFGSLLIVAVFGSDDPAEIKEAVIGVGFLVSGILLMGIQIVSVLLNEILIHTKQGSEASKEVAVRLRNRNGSGR